MPQRWISLLDSRVGSGLTNGGTVYVVPETMNAGKALGMAAASATVVDGERPNLRIFCHGKFEDNTTSGSVEGGYGLGLGVTVLDYANVDKAFAIVRDKFDSIVFLACGAGHYSTASKINGKGDGAGFCLRAAAAANAPVYAPEEIQHLIESLFGHTVTARSWQGPVYKFTPAGGTVIVKAR